MRSSHGVFFVCVCVFLSFLFSCFFIFVGLGGSFFFMFIFVGCYLCLFELVFCCGGFRDVCNRELVMIIQNQRDIISR